jgi:hypothetical protein
VKSCAHWLSWRSSFGLGAAREHVGVARRLRALPLVVGAFATGELSYCKVRAITRVATPETEEQLVELARHATGAQLEKVVRGYRSALAATLPAAERAFAQRYLRWDWDEDGSLRLEARLPADDGALLLAALSAAEREAPEREPAAGEDSEHEDSEREDSERDGSGLGAWPSVPEDVSAELAIHFRPPVGLALGCD